MTEQQFEQIEQDEWDKFCRRYPAVTNDRLISRLTLAIFQKGTQRLLWENGFRHGWIMGIERYQKEQEI